MSTLGFKILSPATEKSLQWSATAHRPAHHRVWFVRELWNILEAAHVSCADPSSFDGSAAVPLAR
jgi:hypothetical protein